MPAPVELFSVVVAFGLVIVAGAWLGAGSHLALIGLFPAHGGNDWPRGVQEDDAPRFAVDHLDALQPRIEIEPDGTTTQRVTMSVHRFDPHR